MKGGGKGFCTFLLSYSLSQGYLDGDEFKNVIVDGNEEAILKAGLLRR